MAKKRTLKLFTARGTKARLVYSNIETSRPAMYPAIHKNAMGEVIKVDFILELE